MIHLLMPDFRNLCVILLLALLAVSCSPSRQIRRTAARELLDAPVLRTAHTGISIYDPGKGTYLFNLQGDKYFVPASNTKLATCYAAMKYLGDSLVGGYAIVNADELYFQPAGDPTLLLSEYKSQPLFDFFKRFRTITFNLDNWREERWGSGWSWNDYDQDYMAERSVMPVYGNLMSLIPVKDSISDYTYTDITRGYYSSPAFFIRNSTFKKDGPADFVPFARSVPNEKIYFRFERDMSRNFFYVHPALSKPSRVILPFSTANFSEIKAMLADTLHNHFEIGAEDNEGMPFNRSLAIVVKTQPTDSLFRPMMHRSDNFFAEQSLLMVSNRVLGYMKDAAIIDTIMKTDFSDLPQKPRWVDGSGLSRYNLFTPQDMVMILDKMRRDFGMGRLKNILATGNTGTLRNYYVSDSSYIFAKTGTLSGVVALSGFLYTQKGRLLEFSILVNNHTGSATDVRRSVEKFLKAIRGKY